jgi:uncharacterized protein YegP (UPF0339 family)
MGKLLRAFVVFAAVAGLTAASDPSFAPAQVKDKDKKDDKAKAAPRDEKSEVIEVYMAKDGWRYRVRNAEGKSVAIAVDGYEKKEDCLKAIDAAKAVLNKGKIVELKVEKK